MTKDHFFERALAMARSAASRDEVPIGAVLVKDGKILSEQANRTEELDRFTAHAELLCIEEATKKIGSKHLLGCELYVTLEPCQMCLHAAKLSRIQSIAYLLPSEKFGSSGIGYFSTESSLHDSALKTDSLALLQNFFQKKR